jgi:hypothetical protein
MGRKRRAKKAKGDSAPSGPAKKRPVKAILMAVVVCAAVGLAIASWRSAPPTKPAAGGPVPPPPPALAKERAATPAPRAALPPEDIAATPERFRPILGEWVRPDGGYVLAIQAVAEDGSVTVGYFNPQPINVGTARASVEDGTLGLFVKLDDTNYPGSTYTLEYDPREDQLVGIYFQAVQRASYDIVFVRKR